MTRRPRLSRGARIVWYTVAAGTGIAFAAGLGVGVWQPRQARAATVADFAGLADEAGHGTAALGFAGHYKLVAFGYTACPDACPATLTKMHGVLAALGADGRGLLPLFVTLDPARDTPDVLRAYVAHFDGRIIALRGADERVQHCAAALGALPPEGIAARTPDGGPNHAIRLYLLSPANELLRTYELSDPTALVVADLQRYVTIRS
jgi:protein SCO1